MSTFLQLTKALSKLSRKRENVNTFSKKKYLLEIICLSIGGSMRRGGSHAEPLRTSKVTFSVINTTFYKSFPYASYDLAKMN